MANASPVTISTFTPICCAVAMVALASSRGGSNRGKHQEAAMGRRLSPRHAKAGSRVPRSHDGFLDGDVQLPALADSFKMTCGAPGHLELFPSGPLTAASVRLCTGRTLEWSHGSPATPGYLSAANHCQIYGVVIVRARRQRSIQDDLIGRISLTLNGSPNVSLFWSGCRSCQRTARRHPPFLDCHQMAHDRCFLQADARRPPSSPTRLSASPRDRGTVSTKANCNVVRWGRRGDRDGNNRAPDNSEIIR